MARERPSYVYFVRRADGEGPVKIGCSQVPEARLKSFMVWSPYRLEIVASIAGDERLEWRFHAKFVDQHSHREWFTPSDELDLVIQAVRDGTFDVESLPPPRRIEARENGNGWTEDVRRTVSWTQRFRWLEHRGVVVPSHVMDAYKNYSWGRYPRRDPADAAIVEEWLADHPRLSEPRRRAA